MHQISRHISYLLLTCRKVEVHGLGTFYASYDNASFDVDFGVFYPSKIRINYLSKDSGHSSLLKDSLRRRLNIKESEAEKLIEDFVEKVDSKIKRRHYCKLEGIGYLISDNGELTLKDIFWKRHSFPSLSPVQI